MDPQALGRGLGGAGGGAPAEVRRRAKVEVGRDGVVQARPQNADGGDGVLAAAGLGAVEAHADDLRRILPEGPDAHDLPVVSRLEGDVKAPLPAEPLEPALEVGAPEQLRHTAGRGPETDLNDIPKLGLEVEGRAEDEQVG